MGIGNNWEVFAENRTDGRQIIYNEQINQVNKRQVEAANRDILMCNVCDKICLSRILDLIVI